MSKHHKFFMAARKESFKSTHHSHKIGCVIVKKNRIISKGFNLLKTHVHSPSPYKSIHAEFHATIGLEASALKGASIYVYRELRDGTIGLSKPCISCQTILHEVGIKNIFYTDYFDYKAEKL